MGDATGSNDMQGLLDPGETFVAQARQHWYGLLRISGRPILLLGAALLGLLVGWWLTPTGNGIIESLIGLIDTLLGLATLGAFVVGVAWMLVEVVRWSRGRCLVTDRRVIEAQGVLRRSTVGAGLETITDVRTMESWLGRRLGFMDLVVMTAGAAPLRLDSILDAPAFRQAILDGQEAMLRERAAQILGSSGGRAATRHAVPSRPTAAAPDPAPPTEARVEAPVEPAHVPQPAPPDPPEEPPRVDWTEDVLPPLPAEEDTSAWTAVPEAVAPLEADAPLEAADPAHQSTKAESVDDVTDTLTRLAELRDEGVISAEDYEAKKAELLDRL